MTRPGTGRFSRRCCLAGLVASCAASGGCLYVAVPVDVHAGPGRHLYIADAETRRPIPGATVLIERYRIEGPMHAAPVVVLHRIERSPVDPDGGYRLRRRIQWQQMWLVWMPEVRHSPVREVVAVKVFAPGHETAWFAVEGPLEGLDVAEEERGPVLYLRPLETPADREAATTLIARHGWPPGPQPMMADFVVPPEVRAQLAPIMIERYEGLLAEFPDYPDAARVRAALDRWRKVLPP